MQNTEYWRQYRIKNREKLRVSYRAWCLKNRAKTRAYNRAWYHKNKVRQHESMRKYRIENATILNQNNRERAQKFRLEALSWYGGVIPKCACCGETENKFLSFDHINGRNNAKYKNNHGSNWYRNLTKNEKDPDIQILCYNCNLSKGFYGICPHKILRN